MKLGCWHRLLWSMERWLCSPPLAGGNVSAGAVSCEQNGVLGETRTQRDSSLAQAGDDWSHRFPQ